MIQSLVDIGPRFQEGFGDNYWEALGDYCPGISIRNMQEKSRRTGSRQNSSARRWNG